MTDVQFLAFVVAPLTLAGVGWAVALWVIYSARHPRRKA